MNMVLNVPLWILVLTIVVILVLIVSTLYLKNETVNLKTILNVYKDMYADSKEVYESFASELKRTTSWKSRSFRLNVPLETINDIIMLVEQDNCNFNSKVEQELCYLEDTANMVSVYLGMYDNELVWTLSNIHSLDEEGKAYDWDNVDVALGVPNDGFDGVEELVEYANEMLDRYIVKKMKLKGEK